MYNKEQLIEICEKAIVPHKEWINRDTSDAQAQIAVAAAYLKCGCDFRVLTDENNSGGLATDKETIWLEITFSGFGTFEGGDKEKQTYFLPTPERIKNADMRDWY